MSRRKRRLASRLRDYLRNFLAFLFSNVGVVVLVVAYTVAGAFMFRAIEGASEMERAHSMTLERDNTAQGLWQDVLKVNIFNDTHLKHRISVTVQQYQEKVVRAVKRGWDGGRAARQWSFSSAFLYSLTVITTIGYGHLSPRTSWGKVTTILYTLLGMPLFLLYLANVGELLARWFKCLYALVCLCRGCPGFTRRRVVRLRQVQNENCWRWLKCLYSLVCLCRGCPGFTPRRVVRLPTQVQNENCWRWIKCLYALVCLCRGSPMFTRRWVVRLCTQLELSDAESIECPEHWRRRAAGPPGYEADATPDCGPPLPHPKFTRRPDYLRSASMPTRRAPRPPDPRRWSEPPESVTSEFSYVTFDAQTITVPISVCVSIMVGYIMFGSMIFGLWERWDQLDGAYFCFISLSSIGFGDFVPGERVYTQRIETSFIVCSMYLMLGMALVAMCFNLMQEQVRHYFAGMKRAFKRICRCKR